MYFKRSNVQKPNQKHNTFRYLISEFLASEKPLWEHLSRSTCLIRSERFPPKVPAPTSQFGATRPYLDPAHRRWDIPHHSSNIGRVASSKGSPVFSACLRKGDRKPMPVRESKQFLFVMNSQIGLLSLYFYKLHTQHEDTIDANNIQTTLHKLHNT